MNPKISIIMPVYNKGRYLNTILEQITGQSYKAFECIIINDGSTDDSGSICDKHAKNDDRLKVIHKENGGVSAARNAGLDLAKGDFITFIDADDEITSNYLECLYSAAVASGAEMVIGGCKKFWDNKGTKAEVLCPYEGLVDIQTVLSTFVKKQYETGIYGYCAGKLISADIVSDNRFDESIRLAEDLDFYLSIYTKLKNIFFLGQNNYFYRQEADNSSALVSDFDIDYFSQIKIHQKIYNTLKGVGTLDAESEELVIKRMYDYVYFCIFYSPISKIASVCKEIKALGLPPHPNLKGQNFKRRWVLKKYEKGSYGTIRLAIRLNRALK